MIELREVFGGYGRSPVLRDVSLLFPDGLISAVIGPNGCGKSTLFKLCAGQMRPSGGGVLVDGRDLSALTPLEIARRLAYMPQIRPTPYMTVETLVLHGRFPWLGYPRVYREQDRKCAEAAMLKVGIWNKRNEFLPHISGGERQRAYLAMALAQGTGHLLLDEPTTHLDISCQLEFAALLRALRDEGTCVVVVLHDIGTALDLADRVAVLRDGRPAAAGTPEQILQSGAVEEAFGVRITRGERIGFALESKEL
jgi:iron complex transport system ATP-binding protein